MPLRGRVVRVLELGAVIESKEEANRPKDLAVLPVLRETLAARRRRGERRGRRDGAVPSLARRSAQRLSRRWC